MGSNVAGSSAESARCRPPERSAGCPRSWSPRAPGTTTRSRTITHAHARSRPGAVAARTPEGLIARLVTLAGVIWRTRVDAGPRGGRYPEPATRPADPPTRHPGVQAPHDDTDHAFWSAVWMQTDGATAHTTMPDGDVGVVEIHDNESPTPASKRFLSNNPSSSGSVYTPRHVRETRDRIHRRAGAPRGLRLGAQRPDPPRTAGRVLARILRSSHSDQRSM